VPLRLTQPEAAHGSIPSTLDTIRSSPAKSLSIACAYLPSSNTQSQHLCGTSDTSSGNSNRPSSASKRPLEVVDLISSDDDSDVPITPKRHRSIALPRNDALEPALISRRASPYAPLPPSAQFHAVEVPIKRPFAVIPKTPAAVARRQLFEKNLRQLTGPKITVVNEIDETSPSTDFRFVQKSVNESDVEHAPEEFMAGCNCYKDNGRQMGCEYLYCECLEDSTLNDDGKRVFPYGAGKKDFRCLRNFYLESRNHIYECNTKCNCEANCKNRNVQHGRRVELEIFKTQNRGWGLRCPKTLRKGDFVDTYRGEIISVIEAERRASERSIDEENYFFNFDKFCEPEWIPKSDFIQKFPEEVEDYYKKLAIDEADTDIRDDEEFWQNPEYVEYEYVCDGMYVGSPTRFMNHSCDPNCRLFTVSYNHADTNLYDLAFFTLEEIPAGTELTFDYKDEDDRTIITDEQARQVQKNKGYMPQKCLCGTAECRRYFFN
ncbi:MAG: hypothetical protein Q9169_008405, partial [Polycauliona sp. 2 TL-2023]